MDYTEQAEHERRIGDWDLVAALRHNDLGDYIPRIDRILATVEGENEGSDWHWIVTFNDTAEIGYITGGCDYTGWD